MKIKEFKQFLEENADIIGEVLYILPDDSETKSKGTKIPDSVLNQPFFSASVTLNPDSEDEAETTVLVQNPRAISTEDTPPPPKPTKLDSPESLELARSREYYQAMMDMTNKSFERVFHFFTEAQKSTIEAIRENERTVDRRVKMFIKDAREGMESDLDAGEGSGSQEGSQDSLKVITDAVAGVFKRLNKEEKEDE